MENGTFSTRITTNSKDSSSGRCKTELWARPPQQLTFRNLSDSRSITSSPIGIQSVPWHEVGPDRKSRCSCESYTLNRGIKCLGDRCSAMQGVGTTLRFDIKTVTRQMCVEGSSEDRFS